MRCLVRNNKGQFLIETVLLMVLTLGLFMASANFLREKKVLAKLIASPWEKASGMIEAGIWDKPEQARTKHPNQIKRSLTLDPRAL